MRNNLLKELTLKIKYAKLDSNTKKDLNFLKYLTISHDENYRQLATEVEKKKYLEKYLPTEKQYREMVGLYHFSRENFNLTERELQHILKSQLVNKYSYIQSVRFYVPNILDRIAVAGPLSIVMEYIKQLKKIDQIKAETKMLKEKEIKLNKNFY